jgi:zinc ribbon protein
MSRASAVRRYPVGVDRFFAEAIQAGVGHGYRLLEQRPDTLVLGEPFKLLSFTWPGKITITCQPEASTVTANFTITNFGFGPIQTRHVNTQLELLLTALSRIEATPDGGFCSNCGSPRTSEAKFCSTCGSTFASTSAEP